MLKNMTYFFGEIINSPWGLLKKSVLLLLLCIFTSPTSSCLWPLLALLLTRNFCIRTSDLHRPGHTALLVLCSILNPLTRAIYVSESPDPCRDVQCPYGGRCVPSGLIYTCRCPTDCPSFGGQPVCGSDGVTYDSLCELKRRACVARTNVTAKFNGQCGKYIKHWRICFHFISGLTAAHVQ